VRWRYGGVAVPIFILSLPKSNSLKSDVYNLPYANKFKGRNKTFIPRG